MMMGKVALKKGLCLRKENSVRTDLGLGQERRPNESAEARRLWVRYVGSTCELSSKVPIYIPSIPRNTRQRLLRIPGNRIQDRKATLAIVALPHISSICSTVIFLGGIGVSFRSLSPKSPSNVFLRCVPWVCSSRFDGPTQSYGLGLYSPLTMLTRSSY
jgi:hypothetical protein